MSCTEAPRRRATVARPGAALVAICGVLVAACAPPRPAPVPPPAPAPRAPAALPKPPLASPLPAESWDQLRHQAALRMVDANPGRTYSSPAPDPLLAIPVLEIELRGDGSIRRIVVLREPRQAKDTTQLAIDAVRRAAPFGDVSRLPRPWKFTETFLFDDARRFKPRTLEAVR